MNYLEKLELCEYPIRNEKNEIVSHRRIQKVFHIENQAAYFIQLDGNSNSGISLSYAAAVELMKNNSIFEKAENK